MTPEQQSKLPDDVRRMLATAKPEQLDRLLWDILTVEPQPQEAVKYDA
jgi:hypothetical protein